MLSKISQSQKRQILYSSHYLRYSSNQSHRDTKSGSCLGLGGGRRIGSYCLIGIVFQIYKMERILEMDGDDGCTTM